MDRARVIETMFRAGKGGREPLAPPGEGGSHVHYAASRRIGVGVITSRNPHAASDEEFLAWRHGLTVTEVRKIIAEANE